MIWSGHAHGLQHAVQALRVPPTGGTLGGGGHQMGGGEPCPLQAEALWGGLRDQGPS